MFIDVGDLSIEALGHDDYPFYKQVAREILEEYEFDSCELEPGDAVIDIGAHIGIVAIYLAKTYGVRVYSYEPEPDNFASLVMNVGANEAKVIPRNLAVTADGRDLEFKYGAHSGEGGGFHVQTPAQRKHRGQITVPSTTVSEIIRDNQLDEVKLLKLDCEGAEHEILASADWLPRVSYIRAELHINDPLKALGFTNEKTMGLVAKERVAWQIANP